MVDICVGSEFSTGEAGELRLKRDGNPGESTWLPAFQCTAADGNGLRKSPSGGLWVPPDHTAKEISEFENYSPNHGVGGGYSWRNVYKGWTITNPSSCRAMLFHLSAGCRWNIAMSPLGQGSLALASFGWAIDHDMDEPLVLEDVDTHIQPDTGAQPSNVEVGHIGTVSTQWTKIVDAGESFGVLMQWGVNNVAGSIRVQQVRYTLTGVGVTI